LIFNIECIVSVLKIRLDLWLKSFVLSFFPIKLKIKILALLSKWVYSVWVWFYPKSVIFYGFFIFKIILTQLPNPTHFFGFFGVGFPGWPNSCTPTYKEKCACFLFSKLLKHMQAKLDIKLRENSLRILLNGQIELNDGYHYLPHKVAH